MEREFVLCSVAKRRETATQVQKVLTDHGCVIRTRLGLHEAVGDRCSDQGVIVLELVGEDADRAALIAGLRAISGATVKTVSF